MIRTTVDPGACGFKTTIEAATSDMQTVHIHIESECPDIQKIAETLKEIDIIKEAFGKIGTTRVYELAAQHCKHAACPVPMAIIKSAEAAAGLALPKNVTVTLEKIKD
ncbi:MAG: hypothetical protein KGY61_12805 [Desulfobacterales bacterium]|nr:hypothetical protein [Desulfobacterales bacterium]